MDTLTALSLLEKLPRWRLSELIPDSLNEYPKVWNYDKPQLINLIVETKFYQCLALDNIVRFCEDDRNNWLPIPKSFYSK